MGREHQTRANRFERGFEAQVVVVHFGTNQFERKKTGVPFIEVEHRRLDPKGPDYAQSTDPE